jgi:hypothetical protein
MAYLSPTAIWGRFSRGEYGDLLRTPFGRSSRLAPSASTIFPYVSRRIASVSIRTVVRRRRWTWGRGDQCRCVRPKHPVTRAAVPRRAYEGWQQKSTAARRLKFAYARSGPSPDRRPPRSAKQWYPTFDLRGRVHSCCQYVTRPPLWHTQRTPPSCEITTTTDPSSALASR